jgi:hypothetical protein
VRSGGGAKSFVINIVIQNEYLNFNAGKMCMMPATWKQEGGVKSF